MTPWNWNLYFFKFSFQWLGMNIMEALFLDVHSLYTSLPDNSYYLPQHLSHNKFNQMWLLSATSFFNKHVKLNYFLKVHVLISQSHPILTIDSGGKKSTDINNEKFCNLYSFPNLRKRELKRTRTNCFSIAGYKFKRIKKCHRKLQEQHTSQRSLDCTSKVKNVKNIFITIHNFNLIPSDLKPYSCYLQTLLCFLSVHLHSLKPNVHKPQMCISRIQIL